MPTTTPTLRLAMAGFAATAVSFGPARMGFGLFLPTFEDAFGLSTTQAGLIASLAFSAFLLALPLTAWLGRRLGQRAPVVAGALAAVAGFSIVATASGTAALTVGVTLAGASAGFCWAPFNDAAVRVVPDAARPGTLSVVSTGTTMGVAAAGALFLAVILGAVGWRTVWGIFALVGVLAAALALRGVPTGAAPAVAGSAGPALLRREAAPLYGAALCFGATNAVFLAFAADHVDAAGGLAGAPDGTSAGVIFLGYGICGLVGLWTGRMEARIGVGPLLGAIFAAFAASLALIAVAPAGWGAVLVAAGLHGAGVMTISAVLSFWSLRVFPGWGSFGFTAALVGVAAGSVVGPALGGALADRVGLGGTFLIVAAAPAAAAILFWAPALVRRG